MSAQPSFRRLAARSSGRTPVSRPVRGVGRATWRAADRACWTARQPMQSVLALMLLVAVRSGVSRADSPEPRCVLPSSVPQSGVSKDEVVGHYRAVSESEWNLEVWLRPDGTAEVLSESWEAGHHSQRATRRYRASWSLSGTFVELRYANRCETLRFDPELGFGEFGAAGAAPGLQGRHSSISNNLFIGRSLWRADRLDGIPEVQ